MKEARTMRTAALITILIARTAQIHGSSVRHRENMSDDCRYKSDYDLWISPTWPGTVSDDYNTLIKFRALETLHVDHHTVKGNLERNGMYTRIPDGQVDQLRATTFLPFAFVWEKIGSEWRVAFDTFVATDGSDDKLWYFRSFENDKQGHQMLMPMAFNEEQLEEEFERQVSINSNPEQHWLRKSQTEERIRILDKEEEEELEINRLAEAHMIPIVKKEWQPLQAQLGKSREEIAKMQSAAERKITEDQELQNRQLLAQESHLKHEEIVQEMKLSEEIVGLKLQNGIVEQRITNMKERLETEERKWEKEKLSLEGKLNDLQQKEADLTRNVKDLGCELETANQQFGELKDKISERQIVIDDQRAQIDEQQKQKNKVDQRETELEKDVQKKNGENARIRAQLVEYKQRTVEQKHELETRQNEIIEAEQEILRRSEEKDHWTMIAAYIVGGVLVLIGFIIFVLSRGAYNKMAEDMRWQLNEQRKEMKQPHPLVPVFPSAHANRLGVHEHPAVRDVFGMKEPWDVTPGEGFHVSRITSGGSTPGTTRGTRKFSVVLDVREGDMEGAEGLPNVSEHNWDGVDP